MKIAVLTTCTASKAQSSTPTMLFFPDPKRWLDQVHKNADKRPAVEVYTGRSFVYAKDVATMLNADFYIMSAGLGLIKGTKPIPSYDVTVGNLPQAASWWNAISEIKIHELVDEYDQVWIAVSTAYMELIKDDLECVNTPDKVIIFTSAKCKAKIHPQFKNVITYTAKQLADAGFDGVTTDQAQRTMMAYAASQTGLAKPAAAPAAPQQKSQSDLQHIKARIMAVMTEKRPSWFQDYAKINGLVTPVKHEHYKIGSFKPSENYKFPDHFDFASFESYVYGEVKDAYMDYEIESYMMVDFYKKSFLTNYWKLNIDNVKEKYQNFSDFEEKNNEIPVSDELLKILNEMMDFMCVEVGRLYDVNFAEKLRYDNDLYFAWLDHFANEVISRL